MLQFEIADLVLNIDSDNELIIDYLGDFAVDRAGSNSWSVALEGCDSINKPAGDIIASDQITWVKKNAGQAGYFLYYNSKFLMDIISLMDVNEQWDCAFVSYLNYEDVGCNSNQLSILSSHLMLGVLFRNHILYHEGIVIHASSLAWKGKGIMFSAPSGTGKSTHARLWQDCFGPEVLMLNDDTPAVRFRDGKPYIFGTPWSGSSVNYCNSRAPLTAIVLLEQAPGNSIRELSTHETVSMMMPRVFLPYFDQKMMHKACDIFERLVSCVPVYLLKCRPDREAVELVSKWVE